MKMTETELRTMERRPYTLLFNQLVETDCVREKALDMEFADSETPAAYRRPMFTERKRITDALLPIVDQLVDEAVAARPALDQDRVAAFLRDLLSYGDAAADTVEEKAAEIVAMLAPAKHPSGEYVIVAQGPEDAVAGSIGPYPSRDVAEREMPKLAVLNGGKLTVVPMAPAP